MNLLSEHIKRNAPAPEAGDYDARELKTKLDIDFAKAEPRFPEVDLDELVDQDKEGDVLLLEPNKQEKKMPNL